MLYNIKMKIEIIQVEQLHSMYIYCIDTFYTYVCLGKHKSYA